MKNESEIFFGGMGAGAGVLALLLIIFHADAKSISEFNNKEAVAHNAAHWEVDTNGIVSFHWNQ